MTYPCTLVARASRLQTYVRAAVAYNPGQGAQPAYDLYVNDQLLQRDVPFRGVSPYVSVKGGAVSIGIKASGSTSSSPYVSTSNFKAPVNSFFTVGFTGPLAGPVGQVAQNTNPIINPDMR